MDERISDAAVINALEEHRFNLGAAAEALGITRSTLKNRVERNPQLVTMMDDFREGIKDKAEDNVIAAVMAGDKGTSQYLLSTLGKERGYHTGVAGIGANGEIVVQINHLAVETPAEQVKALPNSGPDE